MAWNEPGNQNDRDPWGGGGKGGGNQGPPDLDEVIRKLQAQLGKIFGGGGSGSGSTSSGSGKFGGGILALGLVALLIIWAVMGFYTVDQQERAVVLRLGKYHDTVMPGLAWNPPLIDKVEIINVTNVKSHSTRGLMLTEDENIVEIFLSVQYIRSDPKAYYLNVRDPELTLVHATESALRHVAGSSKMHQVLTEGRAEIAQKVHVRLQNYLDNYGTGIDVSKVNIENAQAPQEVQPAFDDVIKAREDEQRVKNEAEAYANGIIPVARGDAQRVREEASAYREQVIANAEGEAARFLSLLAEYQNAPEVTRERLYIDTLQTVMSNSSKIMVDVEGGNNLMYLPLDKITEGGSTVKGKGTRVGERQLEEITNQVIDKIRQRQSNSRLREGR